MAEKKDKKSQGDNRTDPAKGKVFFERAETCFQTRQYDYAIELFVQGLAHDPENVDAHDALRRCGLVRAQSGGKKAGMMEQMRRLGSKTPLQQMLNAEFLSAKDPDNTQWMETIAKAAHKGNYRKALAWMLPIYMEALKKKPRQQTFIMIRDMFEDLTDYTSAVKACEAALALSPNNMDLQMQLKNLGARQTMQKGKYEQANSFRDSIQDAEAQSKLQDQQRAIKSEDILDQTTADARREFELNPKLGGKLMKLVDALIKRERENEEDEAVELLEKAYAESKQFDFKMRADEIRIKQMRRQARMLADAYKQTPDDRELDGQAAARTGELLEFELKVHRQWCESYPTDMRLHYEYGRRLFTAKRYDDGIAVLQKAQNDPKYRIQSLNMLGLCFFAKDGFKQEAIDTFKRALEQYELEGDDTSKEIHYNLGQAYEQTRQLEQATAEFSKVAQWDYNYRDVRQRIEKLRKQA